MSKLFTTTINILNEHNTYYSTNLPTTYDRTIPNNNKRHYPRLPTSHPCIKISAFMMFLIYGPPDHSLPNSFRHQLTILSHLLFWVPSNPSNSILYGRVLLSGMSWSDRAECKQLHLSIGKLKRLHLSNPIQSLSLQQFALWRLHRLLVVRVRPLALGDKMSHDIRDGTPFLLPQGRSLI